MERTVTVFHEGALAYYNVLKSSNSTFWVHLLTYTGIKKNTPPNEFKLQKDGNRWCHEDHVDQELAAELGYIIEMQKSSFESPLYASSERNL